MFDLKIVLKESLTGDNGKFSSKKLTMFVYSLLGVFVVLLDAYANNGKLNEYAFPFIIAMSMGQAVIGAVDKKINDTPVEKTEKEKE